jgi:hypothetical protein
MEYCQWCRCTFIRSAFYSVEYLYLFRRTAYYATEQKIVYHTDSYSLHSWVLKFKSVDLVWIADYSTRRKAYKPPHFRRAVVFAPRSS